MQKIYPYIEDSDNIVITSPIWFSSLSGPLLNLASRLQTIWASRYFRKVPVDIKQKKGVLIIAGAESGTEENPTKNALTIMKFMNVYLPSVRKIYSLDTNNLPADKDFKALEMCHRATEWLNVSEKK